MSFNQSLDADLRRDKYRDEYLQWRSQLMKAESGFFALYADFEPMLTQLSAGALRLYLYIGFHSDNWTGESWHSVDTMAKSLNVDARTVRKGLRELEDMGLIRRVQPRPRGRTFTYLRPLPRTRSLKGRALQIAAEAYLTENGFAIVARNPTIGSRRKVDFMIEGPDGEVSYVAVKSRISLSDLMTWANAARRAQRKLIVLTSESWPTTVESAANEWGVTLHQLNPLDG